MKRSARNVGVLYYIVSESQGAVKIGFTNDLYMRLAGLQTGNPGALEVRWVQNATRDVEAAIHRYLKPFSIGREWYADDGLTCWVADELGYELLDKAETDCLSNGTPYEDACENACLTLADVRRVLPPIVRDHSAWIAAGRPDDEQELEDMAKLDALDAANVLPA